MLMECFKNKKDEKRIKSKWLSWNFKHGHKGITPDNFLDSAYSNYCNYKVDGRYYSGFFNQEEIDFIFEVLGYYEGKILALNGG